MSAPDDGRNEGLHRRGEPTMTDAEFRDAADHIWLDGFSIVRPTDEFLIGLGQMVVDKLRQSDIRTTALSDRYDGSRAAILWVNAS